MARKKVQGICHLCGAVGPLSFEHVPPKAAFNDRAVVLHTIEQAMEAGLEDPIGRGEVSQRGLGGYTLCGRCNNRTGRWYGARFAAWCQQGLEILLRTGGEPRLIYLNYLFPLAIIKQIATMFFSVNGERFREKHPELERFVLDKERRSISPNYRFFVYYHFQSRIRRSGVAGWIDMNAGRTRLLSEITFPPFGYVLTFGDEAPHPGMFEVTHFARFGYQEFAVMEMRMPVLPTHLALPGDYRTREQILRDRDENDRAAARNA